MVRRGGPSRCLYNFKQIVSQWVGESENDEIEQTLDNVAINDVLPLKAARRDAIAN